MALFDYWNQDDDGQLAFSDQIWYGQSFTASDDYDIESVKLLLYRAGSPGTATLKLYAEDGSDRPTGSALATGTTNGNTLTTDNGGEWREITFASALRLSSGTKYVLIVETPSADGASHILYWRDDETNGYSDGRVCRSLNAGSTWSTSATSGYDALFETWGNEAAPQDKFYSKELVAVGNKEVWHESTAGTLTEVTDANGDLNTYNRLEGQEAFQKIFFVNETTFKVFDPINTKLSTADAGEKPTTKDMKLTGDSSGAKMIVDFADGVTDDAAALVYGYRTTTATFSDGETVTGTNADDDTVSFVLNAAEDAPPHWYDWTVHGGDTTNYGTFPDSASLIALYRGRIVINDDEQPHAWHMFKIGDPFKIKYDFSSDKYLSAVTYTNTRLGKVGDIITVFCSISDDLFIFGCANSIWTLVGDPLSEGQLTQLTDDTGIWGPRAWCIDDDNNFYFLGNDGLYKSSIGTMLSKPENISKFSLPNLVKDWDLDKVTHRVSLSFDPINKGLILSRTALVGGANENYWYSLTTKGFFPESYPATCGLYSSYFYAATDETYKKFLIGCQDGYIREFDNSTKNDVDTDDSNVAISSYCLLLQKMGEEDDDMGMLQHLTSVTAGGASGGDFSDSDSIAWSLYKANDAETCLEDVIDGATAFATGTWSGTGRQNKVRPRMRGNYMGLKLANSTASETWAINSITYAIVPKGKR